MNIIHVCSEANPFIKTGGLGDVTYALSKELALLGENVSIILPYYQRLKNRDLSKFKKIGSAQVNLAWRTQGFDIYRTYHDGITYYFIQNDYYFSNRPDIYGYYDDGERFAFFNLATKALIEKLQLQPDIIHIHDWQVGMLPVLIREEKPIKPIFQKTKFVLTIHNPAFQGRYDKIVLGDLYNLPDSLFESGKVRFNSDVSTLKAGIEYADFITTVSPSHAAELLSRQGSWGLDKIIALKRDHFIGILNGIDYKEFDPENDDDIAAPYNQDNAITLKEKNRTALYQKFMIKPSKMPIFSVISRLTFQKGVNLIIEAMNQLLNRGHPCIVLGSGEFQYENEFNILKQRYPDLMGVYIGYDDKLAHLIYAGTDFFLMPSLFEPCGIGQMIAERYGTLPIVRMTGGLIDSVINYDGTNKESANGYHFFDNNAGAFMGAIEWALKTYYTDKKSHDQLVVNAMNTNNSWRKSAKKYLALYLQIQEKI